MLIFTPDGRFSQVEANPDLPKFAVNNRNNGSDAENKAVVQGSFAYFGTYTTDPANTTLTLHITGATFPNWNGIDQTRPFSVQGDTLTFTVRASVGGTTVAVWKRVR